MYGKGVYFARDALVIVRTRCTARGTRRSSVPIELGSTDWRALWTRSEYCRGVKDALTPAERDATTHALYDSTVDDPQNPNIFVTYKDGQRGRLPRIRSNSNRTAIRHHTPQPTNRRIQTTAPTFSPWRPRSLAGGVGPSGMLLARQGAGNPRRQRRNGNERGVGGPSVHQ